MNWGALWSFPFLCIFCSWGRSLVLKNDWSLYLKYLLVGSVNLKILNIMERFAKTTNCLPRRGTHASGNNNINLSQCPKVLTKHENPHASDVLNPHGTTPKTRISLYRLILTGHVYLPRFQYNLKHKNTRQSSHESPHSKEALNPHTLLYQLHQPRKPAYSFLAEGPRLHNRPRTKTAAEPFKYFLS